jgi:hypothetical protein
MLFMTILTYEPGARDQIIKRRAENGSMSQGIKIIGEWSSIASGRVFRLAETDDIMAFHAAAYAWTDLGKLEIYPVMDVEEIMKAFKSK